MRRTLTFASRRGLRPGFSPQANCLPRARLVLRSRRLGSLSTPTTLEILGDEPRHKDPELNTEHDREKQDPVSACLAAPLELTRHRARTLQRAHDGRAVRRYFVFQANVKKGTAKKTLAPRIQTHMPQPSDPGFQRLRF